MCIRDREEVVEHKDDIYYYPDCETMTDVAYYYIDELQALGDIPPSLQNYICLLYTSKILRKIFDFSLDNF